MTKTSTSLLALSLLVVLAATPAKAEEAIIDSIQSVDATTSQAIMQQMAEIPARTLEPQVQTFATSMVTFEDNQAISELLIRGKSIVTLKGDDGTALAELAKNLNELYSTGRLRADRIRPARTPDGKDAIYVGYKPILFVTPKLARPEGIGTGTLTIKLVDDLRQALGGVPSQQLASRGIFHGLASWYGGFFHGRRAANGERFDQWAYTAAHKTLPFGTQLLVTNLRTNKSVVVRVTDRGPYIAGRSLDLSKGAAGAIGMLGSGVARVKVSILTMDRKLRGWK